MTRLENRISLRVTEEEKRFVKSVAESYGLTMTDLVIMLTKYASENKISFVISPKRSRRKKNTRLQRESQPSIEPKVNLN